MKPSLLLVVKVKESVFFLIPCDDVFVPLHDDRTVFDNTAYNTYSTVCRLLNQR